MKRYIVWVKLHHKHFVDYERIEINAESRDEAYKKLQDHMKVYTEQNGYDFWLTEKFEYVYSL